MLKAGTMLSDCEAIEVEQQIITHTVLVKKKEKNSIFQVRETVNQKRQLSHPVLCENRINVH